MSPWIPSHQSLRNHPKKDRLAELLFNGTTPNDVADYAAAGVLHYLWYWALDYAQDGDLTRFTDRQIAKGCRWEGDPRTLLSGLTQSGFVDDDRHIHDWHEYAGKLLEQRERDKQRVKNWREKTAKDPLRVTNAVDKRRKSKEARGRADKSAVPPALTCKCGAELTGSGDGTDVMHCPVCESAP
jgi:hypothetical protein